MQLDPQRIRHFQDRCKARVALSRWCLVQAFTPQPGFLRQLGHALGAGDVAERLGDDGGIVACFFEADFEIEHPVLIGFQVFGTIPFF